MQYVAETEKIIGYKFRDESYLVQALTHSSYANDYLGDAKLGNERLEFLGDAILDMVVGLELFNRFGEKQEGFLSKLRSEIVCEESLANAALALGLNNYLKLGKGEESKGGRIRHSLIADMVEAVIAAVFLDAGDDGYRCAAAVVHRIMDETIEKGCTGQLPKDSKTELQEHCQKKGKPLPVYRIIAEDGPAHDKTFTAGVFLEDVQIGVGKGKTKKEAEAAAAKAAIGHTEE